MPISDDEKRRFADYMKTYRRQKQRGGRYPSNEWNGEGADRHFVTSRMKYHSLPCPKCGENRAYHRDLHEIVDGVRYTTRQKWCRDCGLIHAYLLTDLMRKRGHTKIKEIRDAEVLGDSRS